jgi:DinB superfamily
MTTTSQVIQQLLNSWTAQNKLVTAFFDKYEETAYFKEIAPGRNRPIYLLGHLIAVNDGMIPMFGLGERMFPQLEPLFIRTPDRSVEAIPSLSELKANWAKLNETLANYFANKDDAFWLDRHMNVSPEDFQKEPLRNKLNVLISRINHQSFHMGQLILLTV